MTENVGTWGWPEESRCVLEKEKPGLSGSEGPGLAVLPAWPPVQSVDPSTAPVADRARAQVHLPPATPALPAKDCYMPGAPGPQVQVGWDGGDGNGSQHLLCFRDYISLSHIFKHHNYPIS